MAVSFYLKSPANKDGTNLIVSQIAVEGIKFIYSTRICIPQGEWITKKQRVKPTYQGSFDINNHIERIGKEVILLINKWKIEGRKILKDEFKSELNKAIGREEEKVKPKETLDQIHLKYLISKKNYSDNTIRGFRSSKKKYDDYCEEKELEKSFDMFTESFFIEFTSWMFGQNYKDNYVGKTTEALRRFVKWAKEKGYHNYDYYFKRIEETTDIVYLTEAELNTLIAAKIDNPRLSNIRDRFVVACYTGLRVSNLKRLSAANIIDGYLRVSTVKVKGRLLSIPITKAAKPVFDRFFNESEVYNLSDQKYNEYLKELCEYVGITDEIMIVRHSGKKRIEETGPKYSFISSHTARRTFVTLSFLKGMDDDSIMAITGISSRQTLSKYKAVPDLHIKSQMEKYWG
jgi:site-specific recombinase XerD